MADLRRTPSSASLFWQASEDAFDGGRARDPALQTGPAIVFLAALAGFLLLAPSGLPNGDAAVYAQQVLSADFASRPVHLGYYLLAALLSLFQDVPDYYFNWISCLFGAGALALVYSLARLYLRQDESARPEQPAPAGKGAKRSPKAPFRGAGGLALAAPAALFGNAVFLENAVHAEIYAAQTFFLLASLLLFLRGRIFAAGLCLGVAGLVTPSAVFFAPALLLARRPRPAELLVVAATALAVVLLPILPLLGEYLHGDRGLLAATRQGMGPLQIAAKEAFEVGVGFLAFLPLLALGAWRAAARPLLRPFLAALAAVWAATALLGERFSDVPAQLPTWTLAAVLAALGAAELADRLHPARPGEDPGGPPPARGRLVLGLVCIAAALPVAGLLALRGRAASVAPVGTFEVGLGLAAIAVAFLFGWSHLRAGRSRAAVLLLVVLALAAGFVAARRIVEAKNQRIDAYRKEVLELGRAASPDFLAVGSWERGMLLEHYLFRRSYTEHFLNTAWLRGGWGEERQAKAQADLEAALAGGRQLWLLGEVPEVEIRLGANRLAEPFGKTLKRVRPAPRGPEDP